MENILLSTALTIAILSTTNVFATTPDATHSNLLPTTIQQQSVKNVLSEFKQDKFSLPGSELMFNPQPEPPGNSIKQGGDKTIIIND